jgi:hypothetical protein
MKTLLLNLVGKIKSNLKKWVILALIIVLGLFGYKACRKHQQNVIQVVTNPILGPNQTGQVTINSANHTITVVTPQGTTTTHLSDTTVISVNNHGKLDIYNPSWDFKIHPTVGIGFANRPKLFVGSSLIGYKKLDLNVGLETDCQHFSETAINTSIGFNVHNETYLFLGVNNHRNIEGGLRFRF